jgi:hypothetical protein
MVRLLFFLAIFGDLLRLLIELVGKDLSVRMLKKKVVSRLLLVLLLSGMLWACTNDEKKEAKKTVSQVNPLSFHDVSEGLPKTGLWRRAIAFFDLNNDGFPDILAPPPRKPSQQETHPFVWYGSESGVWKEGELDVPKEIPYGYGSIAVADFNQDEIPDLALAMHMLPAQVLIGTPSGKYVDFSKGLPSAKELTSRGLTAADLNNDGKPDLVIVSEADFARKDYDVKGVMVCYHDGEKWNCREVQKDRKEPGLFADQVVTGDINGDGYKDIAVALLATEKNQVAWINDGKGGFDPFNNGLLKDTIYNSVALGDINQDGRDDLVAGVSGFGRDALYGPRVFLSGPGGFTEYSDGLPEKESVQAVTLGDLNGNGSLELICGTGKGGVKVFTQAGKKWKEMSVSGLPLEGLERIYGLHCLDINHDGKNDIAMNYAPGEGKNDGGIKVFLNGKAPAAKPAEKK